MGITFEWNAAKAQGNLRKHKVSFREAVTVFGDRLSLTIRDEAHSTSDEERYVTIGSSVRQRLLVVVHCDRGDRIRIISARRATRREASDYEEGT